MLLVDLSSRRWSLFTRARPQRNLTFVVSLRWRVGL